MCSTMLMLTQQIAKPPIYFIHSTTLVKVIATWIEIKLWIATHKHALSPKKRWANKFLMFVNFANNCNNLATNSKALCVLSMLLEMHINLWPKSSKTLFAAGIKCWLCEITWKSCAELHLFVRKSFQFFPHCCCYFGLLAIEIKVKHTAFEWFKKPLNEMLRWCERTI